jgi:hypothetical protein
VGWYVGNDVSTLGLKVGTCVERARVGATVLFISFDRTWLELSGTLLAEVACIVGTSVGYSLSIVGWYVGNGVSTLGLKVGTVVERAGVGVAVIFVSFNGIWLGLSDTLLVEMACSVGTPVGSSPSTVCMFIGNGVSTLGLKVGTRVEGAVVVVVVAVLLLLFGTTCIELSDTLLAEVVP